MERIPLSAAPTVPPVADQTPPRWQSLSWPIGLGTLLLAASVAGVALTQHSPSLAGESDSPKGEGPAAAVAYVDVKGGVSHLYPVQQGRVTELPVEEGVEVKKGDVLLQVDDTLPQVRLAEAKIALDVARKQLEQAQNLTKQHEKQVEAQQAGVAAMQSKVEAAQAKADKVNRYLRDDLHGSREDAKIAEKLVKEAESGVLAEKAKLALVQAMNPKTTEDLARLDVLAKEEQVKKATYGVKECKVLAPCDGMLLRRLVSVGEVLGPNPQLPPLVFRPAGGLIIRAEVEQEFASGIAVNQSVRITDDAINGAYCTGKVESISSWIAHRRSILPEPRQFNDVRTLEVIIKPDADAKLNLRIGQRVRVELGKRVTVVASK